MDYLPIYLTIFLMIIAFVFIFRRSVLKIFLKTARKSKFVQNQISKQLTAETEAMVANMTKDLPFENNIQLPKQGMTQDEIKELMKKKKKHDLDTSKGRSFAYVYNHSKEHDEFTTEIHDMFIHTNMLNPLKYNSLRTMENEIVAMSATMFNGDPYECCGSVSSGGSESLFLAVKNYRDRAIASGIKKPELIMSITGHPAINKAGHLFGVKIVFVQSDSKTLKIIPSQVKSAISNNTAMIIVSAPQYAHGVVDDIEGVAKIACEFNIPLHVDSAIGGFTLPFVEKLGYKVPKFDFRVEGVSSISADLHKYGYSAKGASVIVYRNKELRKFQFYSYTEWPGGLYISPTILGTRGGGPLASAWASVMTLGESGFLETVKKIKDTQQYMIKEINNIPELMVMGEPESTIISFKNSKDNINIFHVAEAMEEKGWHIERARVPDAIHCTLMPSHFNTKEEFIRDLKESVIVVKGDPQKYKNASNVAAYGMISSIPDETLVEDYMNSFLSSIYSTPRISKNDESLKK